MILFKLNSLKIYIQMMAIFHFLIKHNHYMITVLDYLEETKIFS